FAAGPDRYDLARDPEVQRRARLVDTVLADQPRFTPAATGLPLSLLAFTRAPVGTDFPTAGNHPTYYLTLLQQPLRLAPPAGPFTVPAALAPGEVVGQSARNFGFSSSGSAAWLELQSGSVTYTFHPPLPARFQPETLAIATRQVGANVSAAQGRGAPPPSNAAAGPAEPGVLAVNNWQTAGW